MWLIHIILILLKYYVSSQALQSIFCDVFPSFKCYKVSVPCTTYFVDPKIYRMLGELTHFLLGVFENKKASIFFLSRSSNLDWLIDFDGVRLRLWSAATNGHIVHPQMIWVGERRWNDMENQRTRRKACPIVTLYTTNPTWNDPGTSPCLRGDRPATNHLSHGTASC
jgi:hypothetical protein